MKRHPLFFALAAALGLAVAAPTLAATKTRPTDVKALKALIESQQAQLDQQQKELQALRESLQQIAGNQQAQQQQIEKVAATPPPAPAPPPSAFKSAPGLSVALNGFVSASAFTQNKAFVFGNGQNAEFPVAGSHGRSTGIDVRSTRFWLDFTGAKLGDNWTGGGRIEMDFFGGFNGTGAYSLSQPTPRLRQAYMDLTNASSGTTVKIGQQWDLMFPLDNVPASLAHVAFPLGYGTGMVGWRFPGAVVMQNLGNSGDTKWRLDLGAFNGSWSGPGNNVNYETAGNAGFRPQLQARLHAQAKDWLAYAVVHYAQIDLRGVDGTGAVPIKPTITSEGFEVGGNWHPGAWMFKGNLYTGKGLGQIFGGLVQFGDIKETGGYLQAGYKFTPNWSANAFYAYSKPNRNDVINWLGHGSVGRLKNRQTALNVQYADGPYAFGLEWMYDALDSTNGTTTSSTKGNQVTLSAMYHF